MTRIRRAVVLLGTATAVLFGGMLPADAQFSNSAALPTMAISSVNVAAPTGLSTTGTFCSSSWNGVAWITTLHARVSWSASASRGVSGYLVTAVMSDGTHYPAGQTTAGTTTITGDYDASVATQNIRVTVTALTSYGWTKESALSGAITC